MDGCNQTPKIALGLGWVRIEQLHRRREGRHAQAAKVILTRQATKESCNLQVCDRYHMKRE